MWGPEGYGFLAVLVRNKIRFWPLSSQTGYCFYTLVLNSEPHGFLKKLVFIIINKTLNKPLFTTPFLTRDIHKLHSNILATSCISSNFWNLEQFPFFFSSILGNRGIKLVLLPYFTICHVSKLLISCKKEARWLWSTFICIEAFV